jgi:predicted Zn-dependent protease
VARVLGELNVIREENFDFLQRVVKEWQAEELDLEVVRKEFQQFQRELFGERVFKSVLHGKEEIAVKKQLSSKENRKIAK